MRLSSVVRSLFIVSMIVTLGTGCLDSSTATEETATTVETATSSTQDVMLTYVTTWVLSLGTHRPEILATPSGELYVIVVEPKPNPTDPSAQIKHQAYHFDADGNQLEDPFPVTTITSEYGDPSDQRALIVEDELVVVYQTNVWEGWRPPQNAIGPMEDYSLSQSLMLARFTLDGTLIKRVPIIANAEPGSQENFPDHAMTWHDGRLFVTTGTGDQALHIREIDLDGTILSTQTFEAGREEDIGSEVGNSLYVDTQGSLVLLSGNGPNSTDSILLTTFNDDWTVFSSNLLPSSGREETFPTGHATYENLELVSYIARETGGSATDFTSNPYSPYLKVIDVNGTVLADEKLGENGAQHVHPTVAVLDDRIFIAWSKRVDGQPQVQIAEYALQ